MEIEKTDPEFAERFAHFAYDEVVNEEASSSMRLRGIWPSCLL